MATTSKSKWSKVLKDYTERFNEICEILSDGASTMQVKSDNGKFNLCMDDGQEIIRHLTQSEMDGVLRALWLMAGESDKSRSIASFFVLKQIPDFHLA